MLHLDLLPVRDSCMFKAGILERLRINIFPPEVLPLAAGHWNIRNRESNPGKNGFGIRWWSLEAPLAVRSALVSWSGRNTEATLGSIWQDMTLACWPRVRSMKIPEPRLSVLL